jgi:methylmalonyl-CoA/ethylmalonyl-CoA epimerase
VGGVGRSAGLGAGGRDVSAPLPLAAKLAGLGPIMQLAYVPTNFDAAIDYWTRTLGVGPFFMWEHIEVDRLEYRGALSTPDFSVALSYWGDLQIELIRQDNDAPSIYRDWNSNALHHVQIVAPDYDEAVAACEREGFAVAMEGKGLLGNPAFQFAYCDLGAYGPAGFIEFARRPEGDNTLAERMERMQRAVREWDGSEAVRRLF